nr:photoreceptor ankyrin repeat protein isoform X2 [Saimiri boliviensis boliviensis]
MVACYHGFQSVVALLSHCPFLDVNQQDKGGDTALMLAAQAGHMPLVSLLLNYYAGLDLERRDQRGLTALMKAAMRNRCECVAALLMAGADLTAVDPVRGKTALEWAVLTDSFDTVWRIRQLQRRPRVEQLSQHYQPEWPALPRLVAQAQAQAQVAPSLLERLQATLSLPFAPSPQEGGVLDHLVTATTSLASPFLATACHTLCPDHPPSLGTRSKSVPELLVPAKAQSCTTSKPGPSSLAIPGAQDGEEEAGGEQNDPEVGEDGLGQAGNRSSGPSPGFSPLWSISCLPIHLCLSKSALHPYTRPFIPALFAGVKEWKQAKCPSIRDWLDGLWM